MKVQHKSTLPNKLVSAPEHVFNVYVVLRAEDTICFTASSNDVDESAFENATASASFTFIVPSPLKVHNTVHSYLISTASTAMDDDFIAARNGTVTPAVVAVDDDFIARSQNHSVHAFVSLADDDFFRTSNTTRAAKQSLTALKSVSGLPDYLSIIHNSQSAIVAVLASLTQSRHNIRHLETFYWTASPRASQAKRSLRGDMAATEDRADQATQRVWRRLARSMPTPGSSDPCGFGSLPTKHLKVAKCLVYHFITLVSLIHDVAMSTDEIFVVSERTADSSERESLPNPPCRGACSTTIRARSLACEQVSTQCLSDYIFACINTNKLTRLL